jgi:hypothetical protein
MVWARSAGASFGAPIKKKRRKKKTADQRWVVECKRANEKEQEQEREREQEREQDGWYAGGPRGWEGESCERGCARGFKRSNPLLW